MEIKIKRVGAGKLPEYKTEGSVGADCYARISGRLLLGPGETYTIPLGFAVEIPEGYEMQIRPRSGLASKNKIDIILGTIDSDYRGEVRAIFWNCGDKDFEINDGDRIAQAVIAPVIKAKWNEVENISETERGEGGFGHTGIFEKNIDKFYEPFKKLSEIKPYFGKVVEIDDNQNVMVVGVEVKKAIVGTQIEISFRHLKNNLIETMNTFKAFERVRINGHRFGKEIEDDENN